jgi:hypothetical protein
MGTNPLGLGIEMACHVRRRLLRGDQKRMTTEADTCRKYVVPKLQAAGWENVAEITGKFGGADNPRNP